MTDSTAHISDDDLDAFVTDLLDESPRARLESHVAACEPCARRLSGHARAEQAMHELAGAAHVASPKVRWAAAAVAAGLVVALGASRAPRHSPRGDTITTSTTVDLGDVICPDGDHQADCIRTARAHARIVVYPADGRAARLFELENEPVDEPPVLVMNHSLFGENP